MHVNTVNYNNISSNGNTNKLSGWYRERIINKVNIIKSYEWNIMCVIVHYSNISSKTYLYNMNDWN